MSRTSNTYNVRISGVGSVVGGFNKIGRSMRSAAGAANTLTRFAKNAVSPLGTVIATLSLTAAGMAKAVGAASDLEVELVNITTLMGRNKQSTVELNAATKQLAKTYGSSSILQARAIYQAISSGVGDATQATKVLETANKLAVAGLTDVFTATDALTTVTNAYGLEASESHGKVGDMMQKTVVLGKTTMEQLSRSLGQVAGMAGAAGLEMEEMFGFTAAGTRVLGNTSMSVVGLANMLSAITKQSEGLRKESQRLGVDFSLTSLKAFGLRGMLERVRNSANYTDETFTRLFGNQRAQRLVLGLLSDDFRTLDEVLKGVRDSTGELDASTGKQMETLKKKFERLGAAVETATQSFGELVVSEADLKEIVDDSISEVNLWAIAFDKLGQAIRGANKDKNDFWSLRHKDPKRGLSNEEGPPVFLDTAFEFWTGKPKVTGNKIGAPFTGGTNPLLRGPGYHATVTKGDKKFFEEQEKQKRIKAAEDKDDQLKFAGVRDALKNRLKTTKHQHQLEQSIGVLRKRASAVSADDKTFDRIDDLAKAKNNLFSAEQALNAAKASGLPVDIRLENNVLRRKQIVLDTGAEIKKNLSERERQAQIEAKEHIEAKRRIDELRRKVDAAHKDKVRQFDELKRKREEARDQARAAAQNSTFGLIGRAPGAGDGADIMSTFATSSVYNKERDKAQTQLTEEQNRFDALPASAQKAPGEVEKLTAAKKALADSNVAAEDANVAFGNSIGQFLQPLRQAIVGAQSFAEAMGQIGVAIAEVIIKMVLMKALSAIPGIGPVLSGVAGAMNEGGRVPGRKYNSGIRSVSGGQIGRDSVLTALTPGETVVSAPDTRALERISKKTGINFSGGQQQNNGTTIVIQGPQVNTLALPNTTENARYYDRTVRRAARRVERQKKI